MEKDADWRLTREGKIFRKGVKKFPNKDIYEGELVNGICHGKGVMMYAHGNKYVGEFENNFFNGFGEFFWFPTVSNGVLITGKRYAGNFVKGKRHGKGLFVLGNGDTYTGMFENGLYHGQGVLKMANGDIYEGEFARGLPHGNQKITYANGDHYEGNMLSSKFHGKGKFTWSKGQGSYDGIWQGGLPHGKGTRIFANNNQFIGNFQFGEMTGNGVMIYCNGDQYSGEWHRGHFHGKGSLVYKHGDKYEGMFQDGYMFGEGKYTWADGGSYEGEYFATGVNKITKNPFPRPNGQRHGYGIRIWSNGNRYQGEWRSDVMHGHGTLTNMTTGGGTYTGQFYNGIRHGIGVEQFGNKAGIPFTCPLNGRHGGYNYCTYRGHWRIGMLCGQGVLTCCDGRVYEGEWKDNLRHGKGKQTYLREGDIGDPARCYIGGVDSLYRIRQYDGMWVEGERHGHGTITYVNGVEVEGELVRGQLHGLAAHKFKYSSHEHEHDNDDGKEDRNSAHRSLLNTDNITENNEMEPRIRYAMYSHGYRLHWQDITWSRANNLIDMLKEMATETKRRDSIKVFIEKRKKHRW